MRAFVSGAAGFIGSHLVAALLERGDEVVAVDSFTPYYDVSIKVDNVRELRASPRCTFVQLDLRTDALDEVLDGVDVVLHQAAQPGVRNSWDHRFGDYSAHNVLGTQRLLDAARRARVTRFVNASSSSIYGNARSYPTYEDTVPAPFSPYGVTKLAAEHLCRSYAWNFDVPTVILRYFTVFGPRQRPDMSIHRLVESALTGEPFPLFGDGSQVREFTYVDDIVRANLAALDAEVPAGEAYNIAGGTEIAMSDLIVLVEETTGREIKVDRQPAMHGDVARNSGAIDKARAELAWSPVVALDDGVRRQVDWHKREARSFSPRPTS